MLGGAVKMGLFGAVHSLIIALTLHATTAWASARPFAVVGYVPEWRYENIDWDALAQHNTHLILFSLEVTEDGGLTALDRLPDKANLARARAAADEHGTQLLLCFGGFGRSGGFGKLVRSAEARTHFVQNLVAMLDEHALDGVDFNWEYPRGKEEWDGLSLLVKETRKTLGRGKPITMAYYPDGAQEHAIAVHNFISEVDLFLMMCYDQSGKHATDTFMEMATYRTLTRLPAEKVALGLPFYSRHVQTGDWKGYDELLRTYGDQLQGRTDEVDGHYFNGRYTIERKTRYAIDQGLAGVMIWESGQDCSSHPTSTCSAQNVDAKWKPMERSLHEAISNALRRKLGPSRGRSPPAHDEL